MKKLRYLIFDVLILLGFAALIYSIIRKGRCLETEVTGIGTGTEINNWSFFLKSFITNVNEPLAILLVQIVTIIFAARLLGWICKKIGQPTVIGEILAGIILGPSFLGMHFPELFTSIFPAHSLSNLQSLSQIGLILFLFVVGMELDLKLLGTQAREAVVISNISIIVPFTMGIGLAYLLYSSFAPAGIPFLSFALFLGISMSITAFPVLARIVQEKGLHKSKLGTIAITCAAVDDISAWLILATVIAIVKAGSFLSAIPTILMALLYVFIMLKLIRPFLKKVGDSHASRENLNKSVVAFFFLILLSSSCITEIIGIHALFGAFIAGVIMPDNQKFKQIFIEKVEDIALVLLLPLFFVFTGLRTQIGLLNDPHLWKVTGLVIGVAVAGKFAGGALSAKFVGQSWKDSLLIGALMNTRGLVELVALNIGYDLNILTPEVFTMLVIMALVTTFMTAPAMYLIEKTFRKKETPTLKEISDLRKYKILISFANPEMGRSLLRIAYFLINSKKGNSQITALHFSPNSLLNKYKINNYEKESFIPILEESQILNYQITTIFKISENIESDIAETANNGNYDLLIIGIGQSVFQGSLLGNILGFSKSFLNPDYLLDKVAGKDKLSWNPPFSESTRQILVKSIVPVGIFIDNHLKKAEKIVLFISESNDAFLIEYARRFIHNPESLMVIIDENESFRSNIQLKETIRNLELYAPDHIVLLNNIARVNNFPDQYDLMILSLTFWQKLVSAKSDWLTSSPSILIIKA